MAGARPPSPARRRAMVRDTAVALVIGATAIGAGIWFGLWLLFLIGVVALVGGVSGLIQLRRGQTWPDRRDRR